MKGGILLSSTGYIQARVYTSTAQLPLRNAAIVITAMDGTAIAMRITDRSGLIDAIEIPVPDKSESQKPNPLERPYTMVNLYAYLDGYESVESQGVQVFSGITTYQDIEMIPLAEFSDESDNSVVYQNPPQNL